MAVCIECGRDVIERYYTIKTQRKSVLHICYSCADKNKRKEVAGADNSKQSVQEHR